MPTFTAANAGKGVIAGFAATVVLSLLMVMKQAMGIMPDLDSIKMLSQMMGNASPVIGWIAHFMIGSIVWGVLFAWLAPRLTGPLWFRGVLFATAAWLMMMIVIMPMAGAGFFGLNLGIMAPIATLMLHWVFGAVLGSVYGSLAHTAPAEAVLARH